MMKALKAPFCRNCDLAPTTYHHKEFEVCNNVSDVGVSGFSKSSIQSHFLRSQLNLILDFCIYFFKAQVAMPFLD